MKMVTESLILEKSYGAPQNGGGVFSCPTITSYFHGYFDWIIIFAADDIVQANKVVRNWKSNYVDTIEDIQLQEELMSFRCGGFLNPDYEEELKNIL